MSNPFLQALAAADKDRQTHYERQAVQTRAHFAAHPECAHKILSMNRDGSVARGKALIDVEARCKPGWFTAAMWKQSPDGGRPLEELRAQSEGYWYRIDDLRLESKEPMPAGTREAARLWKAALVVDAKARQAEAARKAEGQRKKLELAQFKREAQAQRARQQTPQRVVQTPTNALVLYTGGL
jgi:hypothetical protein